MYSTGAGSSAWECHGEDWNEDYDNVSGNKECNTGINQSGNEIVFKLTDYSAFTDTTDESLYIGDKVTGSLKS